MRAAREWRQEQLALRCLLEDLVALPCGVCSTVDCRCATDWTHPAADACPVCAPRTSKTAAVNMSQHCVHHDQKHCMVAGRGVPVMSGRCSGAVCTCSSMLVGTSGASTAPHRMFRKRKSSCKPPSNRSRSLLFGLTAPPPGGECGRACPLRAHKQVCRAAALGPVRKLGGAMSQRKLRQAEPYS